MASQLISIAHARALVLDQVHRLEPENVEIGAALDRVLASDVVAAGDTPPFACSAMDGYAVMAGPAGRTLRVVAESRAGTPSEHTLAEGEAIRISTGAAVPAGANAVIRQEDVIAQDSVVQITTQVRVGENIRDAGEDMRGGSVVLRAGTVLGSAHLGAAVAAGAAQVSVVRQPAVAVLSTGDELKAPGEPLGPGEIHNSNATMLAALTTKSGGRLHSVGRLPDDRARTEAGLAEALTTADVVIVTGGVSVGPHDHVKPALAALAVGEIFWGVSLQPGKPTWFGARAGKLVFGLPGNPVSAVVTFSLFARPALLALLGSQHQRRLEPVAYLAQAVRRNQQREQALRVRLERDGTRTFAHPTGPQGSHVITSLLDADALAMIPPGDAELEPGAQVALEELAT